MEVARIASIAERLRMSLWFIPSLCVLGALALAAVTLLVDRGIDGRTYPFFLAMGADSARGLLSTIAATLAASISLIFSVTIVVLQLGSAQYSPRILRTYIRDRFVQTVLGFYIGSFAYALVVLPAVRSRAGDAESFVPTLSVITALGLMLGSLALFVRYVHHIAHAIRAVAILESVAAETRGAIDRLYPEEIGEEAWPDQRLPSEPPTVIHSRHDPGVLVGVEDDDLLEAAVDADAVVRIIPRMGDFVPYGSPLCEVWTGRPSADHDRLRDCFVLGAERTMRQDAGFGLRQMVDIAERALSPGTNDPTTAVQALDQLHDALRRLVRRRFPSPARLDDQGQLRVVAPRMDWDDYVALAFDEIRIYGGNALQVTRRMSEILDDLSSIAPPERLPPLRRQQALLDAVVARHFPEEGDRLHATQPSRAL